MQDLGISVLFEGQNFIRLLGGLWVTIRIAGLSLLFGESSVSSWVSQ